MRGLRFLGLLIAFLFYANNISAQDRKIYVVLANGDLGMITDNCSFTSFGLPRMDFTEIALCPCGILYGIGQFGQFFSVDTTTHQVSYITTIPSSGAYLTGLVCDKNNNLFAASDQLYKIDRLTGSTTGSFEQQVTTVNNAAICSGDSVPLIVKATGTISWSPAAGLSSIKGNTVMASPAQKKTYKIIVTNAIGCKDSVFSTVTVHPTINVQTTSGTICAKDSVQLYYIKNINP